MNKYEQKLKDYITQNQINAEQLIFATSCHSVQEAAESANAKPEDFVKNVCVINETDGSLIVSIIPGTPKLDLKKLASILETNNKKLRLANSKEILEKTGYPVGGTPSFGYSARFFMDETIFAKPIVFSGGGSPNALTKCSPEEIIRVNKAIKGDLTK